MNRQYLWVSILIYILFLSGCGSVLMRGQERLTYQSKQGVVRIHEGHKAKAESGNFKAVALLAEDYCSGINHYQQRLRKPPVRKKYTFMVDAKKCGLWIVNALQSFDDTRTKIDSEYWRMYRLLVASPLYYERNLSHLQKASDIVKNKNSRILNELWFAVISNRDSHYGKRTLALQKGLAEKLCDEHSLNKYCSFLGHTTYLKGDFKKSANYFFKHNKVHVWDYYAMSLVDLCLNHEEYIPKGNTCPNNLHEISLDYFKSMKRWCEDEDSSHLAITSNDCKNYKYLKTKKKFITSHIALLEQFENDRILDLPARQRKYKIGLTQSLKNKDYALSLTYFDLMEKLEVNLPDSMIFYKAESLYNVRDFKGAKEHYQQYLKNTEASGHYAEQAKQRLALM